MKHLPLLALALSLTYWSIQVATGLVDGEAAKITTIGDPDDVLVDDSLNYLKPSISEVDLLRARGYLAREYTFKTPDNYVLTLVRATNPLINNGKRGLDSKLPILFVHPTITSSSSFLINSIGVRPRFYKQQARRPDQELTLDYLIKATRNDPAVRSLPLLALNFGYECWFLQRRGYNRSRNKIGRQNRTLDDAWASLPWAIIGNSLNGFTMNANMDFQSHPARVNFTTKPKHKPTRRSTGEQWNGIDIDDKMKSPHNLSSSKEETINSNKSDRPNGKARLLFSLLPRLFKILKNLKQDFIESFDPDFWDYSMDEQIQFDFPMAVDFVLGETGKPKLHTVGFSLGGAIVLLTLADQPDLAGKISRAVMWAPSLNMGTKTDKVFSLSKLVPLFQGYTGAMPPPFLAPIIQLVLASLSPIKPVEQFFQKILSFFAGPSGDQHELLPSGFAVLLQPTSKGELSQLGQFAHTQRPCKFNFNTEAKNLQRYGRRKPPCYNLANIKLRNISMYTGSHDRLVSADSIATTMSQMKVPVEFHYIKAKGVIFNHFGFVIHKRLDRLANLPSLLDIERSQAEVDWLTT